MTEKRMPCPVPRPFSTAPDVRRYFPASVMEEARERLVRAITRAEGPAQIIGAAGTGKSLLLEVLASQFGKHLSVVSLIGAQLCTRRALLQMILFELKLPYRGMDEGELRLSLVEYLRGTSGANQRMLLLVDEADALPTRLLHELRALTNVSDQGESLVSLVLAGSSILEERFADPEMELFNQRISARCYLSSLSREETFGYIRSHVAASGSDANALFNQDGLEAIYAATDGIPRLINQLGDQLTWMVQETGYQPLDGKIVQQAWSELQQLPAPWDHSVVPSDPAQNDQAIQSAVVEFGDLGGSCSSDRAPGMESQDDISEISSLTGEEDLPASIPFDIQYELRDHQDVELGVEPTGATDLYSQGLNAGGREPSVGMEHPLVPGPEDLPVSPEARNPFAETYATEEVVQDQYLSYESQLLQSAIRVVNREDERFANELQQCITRDVMSESTIPQNGGLRENREIVNPGMPAITSDTSGNNSPTSPLDPKPKGIVAKRVDFPESLPKPTHAPAAVLVQGQHFQQLFNQLESGASHRDIS